jgi:hypothetical protein
MCTTWPAVISVCGPMNQPVPIHIELSAAVISSDACARHGLTEVLVICTRSSGPCTVSALGGGGPNDASPISRSWLVLGATNNADIWSSARSVRPKPGTASVPSSIWLVPGFSPSEGGSETGLPTASVPGSPSGWLETGACGPVGTAWEAVFDMRFLPRVDVTADLHLRRPKQ